MMMFEANPRDGAAALSGACGTCCCQPAVARPGEVNPWLIDYAGWSVPIGGRGLACDTKAFIEPLSVPETTGAPTADFYAAALAAGAMLWPTQLVASDPNSDPLTFALVPWAGPEHGAATITPAGLLSYTPNSGFAGIDRFFYTVSDGTTTVVQEIAIRVNAAAPAVQFPVPAATPALEAKDFAVDGPNHLVRFRVAASPAVRVGTVYRMTIKQTALDCDCKPYTHIACFDVQIVKC